MGQYQYHRRTNISGPLLFSLSSTVRYILAYEPESGKEKKGEGRGENERIYGSSMSQEPYQLEKEVLRNTLEKIDILSDREEEVVCNAGTNGSWQAIQSVLLFQSFCFELETYVRQHLILNAWGQLIPCCKL